MRVSSSRCDELQGEVERHQRGGLELQGEDVGLDHLDRQQLLEHGVLGMQVLGAALDHGRRVVHGDHPAVVAAHMAAQGLGHGAERASEVVQGAVRLGELRGEHAKVLDDGRVARHRALDHVRKDLGHVLVEDEVRHLVQGLGEESVGLLFHGGRFTAEKAGILAKSGRQPNRDGRPGCSDQSRPLFGAERPVPPPRRRCRTGPASS